MLMANDPQTAPDVIISLMRETAQLIAALRPFTPSYVSFEPQSAVRSYALTAAVGEAFMLVVDGAIVPHTKWHYAAAETTLGLLGAYRIPTGATAELYFVPAPGEV